MENIATEKAPSVDKKEPIDLVNEVDKELSDYRRPFEKGWREEDNAYYGKHHKTGEEKKTVKNHIFKIIEGSVPILTDSNPGTQITASIEEKQADADILNKSISYVYQDQNLPLIIPTLVRSALTSAPGYLYAFYNPDAASGDGKIEYKQLPWEYVKLDGNASLIEHSEKCRIEIPMRREAIARMWPEKRNEILDTHTKSDSNESMDNDNLEQRDISGSDTSMGKPAPHKAKDIIKYVETWVKSYEPEAIPDEETNAEIEKENAQLLSQQAPDITKWENNDAHIQGHTGKRGELLAKIGLPPDAKIDAVSSAIEQLLLSNPEAEDLPKILLTVKMIDNHIEEHQEMKKLNPQGQKPKYPDGWRLIKSTGKVILYDGPNPECFKDKQSFGIPLVPFYCYKDQTIYGFSEVKNILDAQRTLNDVDHRQQEGLKLVNAGWIADHEAEVDENKLTNEPGIVIIKKKGTEVRRLEAGEVSGQLEARKLSDAEFIEDASGVNRESQGNMAASASGVAIQKLQTQAVGRIRLKDRYLQQYSMRRLAIITASLIINHWTSEKRLRFRSDNSNIEEVLFSPLSMQDLEYTIEISEGSMAGIDKDSLNAFFKGLLDGEHITFEEFLLVTDFPKKDILLTKLRERNQSAQDLEQLQGELATLQEQNATLLGTLNPNLLDTDQKKVFEMASKSALIEKLMAQGQEQQAVQQQEINGNPGVNNGQPVIQGNM